ncbi:hypothetical protein EVAR_38962_1 [Eumeta japonica]|uniref:Uncharacterized protein n=1 Tax=Eumeta variegata TaxID=151549 RepID=A0A4C1W8G5_EUMVA|nr:hypothetical protein EVAR_38962_1 [Eumeta japonica]
MHNSCTHTGVVWEMWRRNPLKHPPEEMTVGKGMTCLGLCDYASNILIIAAEIITNVKKAKETLYSSLNAKNISFKSTITTWQRSDAILKHACKQTQTSSQNRRGPVVTGHMCRPYGTRRQTSTYADFTCPRGSERHGYLQR